MLTSYLQMLLIEAIDNTITVSFQKGGNIWEMSNIFDCKLSELERGVTEIQLQVGTLSKSGLVVIAPSRIYWRSPTTGGGTDRVTHYSPAFSNDPAKIAGQLEEKVASTIGSEPLFFPLHYIFFFTSHLLVHTLHRLTRQRQWRKFDSSKSTAKTWSPAWMAGHLQTASHKLNTTRDVI